MEKNENIKRLVSQCSAIVNLLLNKGYLSESINKQKFTHLQKILEEQEHKGKDEQLENS